MTNATHKLTRTLLALAAALCAVAPGRARENSRGHSSPAPRQSHARQQSPPRPQRQSRQERRPQLQPQQRRHHHQLPSRQSQQRQLQRQPQRQQRQTRRQPPAGADAARAEALLAEGAEALARGDEAAARRSFEAALAAAPARPEAHTYLGVVEDRAGNLAAAERHFATAARLAPADPAARNNHGAILQRLGRDREAAAQFEASLKLNPRQPSALVNLGRLRAAGQSAADLRAARDLFERAREIAPDSEIARALTVIALRQSDAEAARRYYAEYAQTSAADPNAPPVAAAERARLGAALLEAKLAGEAVAELSAAVAADPANVEAVVKLSEAHLARGETAEAGRALEGAVARGLEAAPVYAALAALYERVGRVENAIPAMRLAIERAPGDESYRFRYALMLIDTRAPKAAIIRTEEALQKFPRSARLWFALGLAHLALHQNDEAIKALARAVEFDPRSAPAVAYLGLAHAEQGHYAEATRLYERTLALMEQSPAAHYLFADLLLKQSEADTARAERHLLRAVALDPSLASARLALARLYARAGKFAEAAAQLERVIKLEPDRGEAHYQLARAYQRLGRAAEAQAALAEFKRLGEGKRDKERDEIRDIARRLANVRF